MSIAQGLYLSVAKEFSETPGPRSREEGDFSGEEFLDRVLVPKFDQAVREKVTLTVDLDGTEGYATSFLESAFGGLARRHSPKKVLEVIRFKSDDEPFLIDEIKRYVTAATQ
ncbi:MAG: STAS-like domain-containing protein [Bryobacteraceae bacterium]